MSHPAAAGKGMLIMLTMTMITMLVLMVYNDDNLNLWVLDNILEKFGDPQRSHANLTCLAWELHLSSRNFHV